MIVDSVTIQNILGKFQLINYIFALHIVTVILSDMQSVGPWNINIVFSIVWIKENFIYLFSTFV